MASLQQAEGLMDITVNVTIGDNKFGVDMIDHDPADLFQDMEVAAKIIHKQLSKMGALANINDAKALGK
jgi:hypothetical protein